MPVMSPTTKAKAKAKKKKKPFLMRWAEKRRLAAESKKRLGKMKEAGDI